MTTKNEAKAVARVVQTVVQKPNVMVEVEGPHGERAFGFAKWSTEDQAFVEAATKFVDFLDNQLIEADQGTDPLLLATTVILALETGKEIERLDWSEERGIELATDRAAKDLARQIDERKAKIAAQDLAYAAWQHIKHAPLHDKARPGLAEQDDSYIRAANHHTMGQAIVFLLSQEV